ncbi:MAG: hypothetical protein IIA14_12635 [SAR324 cluster bacterium]|nr:hypothetical protein [SAR324 cluster bacterium]
MQTYQQVPELQNPEPGFFLWATDFLFGLTPPRKKNRITAPPHGLNYKIKKSGYVEGVYYVDGRPLRRVAGRGISCPAGD